MKNKNKLFKQVTLLFIVVIIIQFCILAVFSGGRQEQIKKASELLQFDAKYTNSKSVDERAKMLFVQEKLNLLKESRIRKYASTLTELEKLMLIQGFNDSIKILNDKNPKRALEMKHDIQTIEHGYNPISYFMEKLLGLTSLEFLENQKNYFALVISVIAYITCLITIYIKKP